MGLTKESLTIGKLNLVRPTGQTVLYITVFVGNNQVPEERKIKQIVVDQHKIETSTEDDKYHNDSDKYQFE